MKPQFKDDLFPYLNWILKKVSNPPEEQSVPTTFITNRWLSMLDTSLAQMVNVTFNRWNFKTQLFKENSLAGKLYRVLSPKINKKFSYIKKPTSTPKDVENLETLAVNMEISTRELELYNNTLDFLNKKNN